MSNINLHPKSKEYVAEVFDRYDIEKLQEMEKKIAERAVLQLYSSGDTRTDNGRLAGYKDSLFFDAILFDPQNDKAWKSQSHDEVTFEKGLTPNIRLFKDGSTMLTFNTSVRVRFIKSIQVTKN